MSQTQPEPSPPKPDDLGQTAVGPKSRRQDRDVRQPTDEQLVEAELLVEEVSIDGMCGVY